MGVVRNHALPWHVVAFKRFTNCKAKLCAKVGNKLVWYGARLVKIGLSTQYFESRRTMWISKLGASEGQTQSLSELKCKHRTKETLQEAVASNMKTSIQM